MDHERLISGVAATLGAIAVVFAVVGVTGSPIALPVAVAFAAAALLMYDQLSGRMAARVYRRVEQRARVADPNRDGQRRRARGPRRRADRGGVGAGPREEWTPPRDGASIGEAAARGGGGAGRRNEGPRGDGERTGRGGSAAGRTAAGRTDAGRIGSDDDGPSETAAYRTLGVEPGADEATIRAAYREKVKEVHPDTPGGDEERFMAVKDAYERLAD